MANPAQLRNLSVILTAQCNLRCNYCYQNAKSSLRMRWETLATALDMVLTSSRREAKVNFVGGEPLLEYPAIGRAFRYLEENRSPGKSIEYSISTNGTLITAEIAAFLARNRFKTQISFDGISAAQNHRGKETFVVLDKLLDHLRRDHPDFFRSYLTIALTLTSSNCINLADSTAYLMGKGVMQIAITPVITPDPRWRTNFVEELDVQFSRIYENSLRQYQSTGEIPLKIFQGKYDGSFGQTNRSEMCGVASGESLVVDVDGEAYGCTVLAGSYQNAESPFLRDCLASLRMDSIHDPAFAEHYECFPEAIRRVGLFHNKEDKYSSYGNCKDCLYITECSACPMSIAHVPGNNDPNRISDLVCAYNLVSRKYREQFPNRPHPKAIFACPPELTEEMKRWKLIAEALDEEK
jgi:sulfatase maturation enzyme AslB (radical SAM superfamily)